MRSVFSFGLLFTLAIVVVSCAKPPTQELDAAQAAIDQAKSAEADVYAADTFRSATTALSDARSKVDQQDYEGAKASAIQAKELADRSRSEAETGKRQTRDEAQAIVNRVATGLSDAQAELGGAPRGKGADEDLDQLRSDLSQTESSLNAARSSIGSSKFKDALAQARSADNTLSQVRGSVQAAMQKIEGWKQANQPWFEL